MVIQPHMHFKGFVVSVVCAVLGKYTNYYYTQLKPSHVNSNQLDHLKRVTCWWIKINCNAKCDLTMTSVSQNSKINVCDKHLKNCYLEPITHVISNVTY